MSSVVGPEMSSSLPSVAVTVPTWRRGEMFRKCVNSLLEQTYKGHIEIMCVVDYDPKEAIDEEDRWTEPVPDIEIAKGLQERASTGTFAGLRSVRIKRGPGRSNWRPGAIHFPVFEHWLQTKCDLVTYQFSDEYSGPSRIELQVQAMLERSCKWSYCKEVSTIDGAGRKTGVTRYSFDRSRIPCNQLMTPSILVDRKAFFGVGGLDYPVHVAAKAEEWIQTHCALVGPEVCVPGSDMYFFRVHNESLGYGQGPNSQTYQNAIAETGWVESDHWDLWNRVADVYCARVAAARK